MSPVPSSRRGPFLCGALLWGQQRAGQQISPLISSCLVFSFGTQTKGIFGGQGPWTYHAVEPPLPLHHTQASHGRDPLFAHRRASKYGGSFAYHTTVPIMPLGLIVGSMNETRTSPRYHWLDNHMFLVLPPEDISLSRGRWSTEIVLSEFVTSVQELFIDRMHIHVFLLVKNKD